MNWLSVFGFAIFHVIVALPLVSQDTIHLKNPSFEDMPRVGVLGSRYIDGWYDCRAKFPQETPPDIHPVPKGGWGVTTPSFDGQTYLGMVIRYNDTYEGVSQKLSTPLTAGKCYSFSLFMAKNNKYASQTSRSQMQKENFTTPAILKIWGAEKICQNGELLGQSPPVDHPNWEVYNFKFQPTKDFDVIILEAFYKEDSRNPYNGHILVDALSPIVEINCD